RRLPRAGYPVEELVRQVLEAVVLGDEPDQYRSPALILGNRGAGTSLADNMERHMEFTLTREHQWLGRLVGEWTWVHEVAPTGDTRVTRLEGTENYRSVGALWVVGESVGPLPEGGMHVSLTTLGWDPQKGRFTGAWIGSSMPFLWVYDGELDE